jgi:hypothetical protein
MSIHRLLSAPDASRATCWTLRQGGDQRATCQLTFSGSGWELQVKVNGTLQWSARFGDQQRLLAAALSWREVLRRQGWS